MGTQAMMEGWVELVVSSGACLTSLHVKKKSEDTEQSLASTKTCSPWSHCQTTQHSTPTLHPLLDCSATSLDCPQSIIENHYTELEFA